MQTSINISERAYVNVTEIARLTERTVDQVIEETFEERLDAKVAELIESISLASDSDLMALIEFEMPDADTDRLSHLLEKNKNDEVTELERSDLAKLMQANRSNDLRKAIGVAEAIKRGLIDSAAELM